MLLVIVQYQELILAGLTLARFGFLMVAKVLFILELIEIHFVS